MRYIDDQYVQPELIIFRESDLEPGQSSVVVSSFTGQPTDLQKHVERVRVSRASLELERDTSCKKAYLFGSGPQAGSL